MLVLIFWKYRQPDGFTVSVIARSSQSHTTTSQAWFQSLDFTNLTSHKHDIFFQLINNHEWPLPENHHFRKHHPGYASLYFTLQNCTFLIQAFYSPWHTCRCRGGHHWGDHLAAHAVLQECLTAELKVLAGPKNSLSWPCRFNRVSDFVSDSHMVNHHKYFADHTGSFQ